MCLLGQFISECWTRAQFQALEGAPLPATPPSFISFCHGFANSTSILAIFPRYGDMLKVLTFSKTIFLHPEGCLPIGTKFFIALTAPFFPTSFLDYSIISLCRPSSAPENPCTAPRSQQRPWELSLIVLRFYLPWSLSSFEAVDTTFHFSETTVSPSFPPSLVSSSQAPWKALTHLPLNVIIPTALVFDLTFFFLFTPQWASAFPLMIPNIV